MKLSRTARKAERQEQAIQRQVIADARTDKERLAILEANGHGHCAEAEKLRKAIK